MTSAAGWFIVGAFFLAARFLQKTLPLNARYFRGAGMALLFFATLRLCYFGAQTVCAPASATGALALSLAVAANIVVGWSRKSVYLTGLAMLTGYCAALAVGSPYYLLGMVTAMTLVACVAARVHDWPWLVVFATPCACVTYLLWAIGNPLIGNGLEVVSGPLAAVFLLLVWMIMNGIAMTLRKDRNAEGPLVESGAILNCGCYILFLAHTFIRFRGVFVTVNVAASLILLFIAVAFWVRERSRFATFVYSMAGYGALSMALIKASAVPNMFVWLSAQSLLVVTTAIWFRSRFIIVANFLIYLTVVAGYMILVRKENGISLVFVLVALTSARILNWQKDRLELKTELMRNAYLTCVFIVFPYALYHLVSGAWVALSWVCIALFYYLMTFLTKSHKYRWLGHNTLLLSVVYILIMGIGKLQGTQRILSFLVLGTVLLAVSLVFTIVRARQHQSDHPIKIRDVNEQPDDD